MNSRDKSSCESRLGTFSFLGMDGPGSVPVERDSALASSFFLVEEGCFDSSGKDFGMVCLKEDRKLLLISVERATLFRSAAMGEERSVLPLACSAFAFLVEVQVCLSFGCGDFDPGFPFSLKVVPPVLLDAPAAADPSREEGLIPHFFSKILIDFCMARAPNGLLFLGPPEEEDSATSLVSLRLLALYNGVFFLVILTGGALDFSSSPIILSGTIFVSLSSFLSCKMRFANNQSLMKRTLLEIV